MIEIQEVIKQITSKLTSNQKNTFDDPQLRNLIIESFVLGHLQRGSQSLTQFQQHLDILVSLKVLVSQWIIDQERLDKFLSDALLGTKDLLKLREEVQIEVIEQLENNSMYQDQSVIFIQSQQQQQQENKSILESQWVFIQKQSLKSPINEQLQTLSAIYQDFRQENQNPQNPLELTIELIKDNQRLEIEQQNKVNQLNYQDIECKICLDKIPFSEKANLYCSHNFHQNCLSQYCTNQLKTKSLPIQCPQVECKKTLIYKDLKKVLEQQILQEFKDLSLKAYYSSQKEYSCCPTAYCTYVFIAGGSSHMDCPVCMKSYCLECKIEYHNGFSCQEYQEKWMTQSRKKNEENNNAIFQRFVKEANYKQCPSCKVWIERNKGCDHMTCKCKFQFCYQCGGEYKKCKCWNNTFFIRTLSLLSGRAE